jgi:integral membrane protein
VRWSPRVTMVRVTTPDPSTLTIDDVDGARSRLTFFKVMAFIVGVGLLVLVVEMVLSYGFGMKGEQNPLHWWPQPHGFIYMVYLVATALLGFKVGWSLTKMVLVMLAGCVPFLSFWVERKVAAEVEAGLAATRQ